MEEQHIYLPEGDRCKKKKVTLLASTVNDIYIVMTNTADLSKYCYKTICKMVRIGVKDLILNYPNSNLYATKKRKK